MEQAMLAIFGLPGGYEWIVILVVALLIFGRRLPDVARSVGKSIVEFKKGIKDVKDDIDSDARLDSKPDAAAHLDNGTTSKSQNSSSPP